MDTLVLTGRESSHFTRVARMFAHELGLAYELRVVHDLASTDPDDYAGNPSLRVPTLHVGGSPLFGSESICRRFTELAGREGDDRIVLPERVRDDLGRSAHELVGYAMAAQVQIRIGTALGDLPADCLMLTKARAGLTATLAWLETNLDEVLARLPAERQLSHLEVSLFCLLEHVVFRPTVPLDPYPGLRAFVAAYGRRESALATPFRLDRRN